MIETVDSLSLTENTTFYDFNFLSSIHCKKKISIENGKFAFTNSVLPHDMQRQFDQKYDNCKRFSTIWDAVQISRIYTYRVPLTAK